MSLLSIDTIKLRIPVSEIQSANKIDWMLTTINPSGEIVGGRTWFGNINMNFWHGYIYLEGSISKYWAGSNVVGITYLEFTEAIAALEDMIGLSLAKWSLVRVDIAASMQVREPAHKYIKSLEYTSKFIKNIKAKGSITFKQAYTSLKFYDKVAEAKKQGLLPAGYNNNNLLRYELMLSKGAIKAIFKKNITLLDLTTPKCYSMLIYEWVRRYAAIHKGKSENFDPAVVSQPSQIKDYLAYEGVNSVGLEKVFDLIESTPSPHNNSKKRMKDMVMSVMDKPYITDNGLIGELDEIVERVCLDAFLDLEHYFEYGY